MDQEWPQLFSKEMMISEKGWGGSGYGRRCSRQKDVYVGIFRCEKEHSAFEEPEKDQCG